MLRRSFLFLIVAFAASLTPDRFAIAAAPQVAPAILVPIDDLVRAANAGSIAGARSAYVTSPSIVDDFAPFAWYGPTAVARWSRQLAAVLKQYKITQGRFARHAPAYAHVAGKRAWLVIPSDFRFVLGGRPQKVASAWTFVLDDSSAGWRIESSTWSTTGSTLE